MDTSKTRVLLQGVAKIFKARLKSKTWDIHGMPQFIMMTHCEGCETCNAYASHVVKASEASMVEILSREVEKAFWIAWPNIVCHIEDEASSESDKKVEWYSDHHDNLTNNVRMAENKASTEWDCCQKADEKLAQANSRITELGAPTGAHCPANAGQMNTDCSGWPIWVLGFWFRTHFWPIKPEKEEGPGVPTSHQLWGLLPEWSQYVGTGWWTDVNDGIIVTGSGVSDPTASGTPTHIKDCSSVGEGWPPNFGNRSVT